MSKDALTRRAANTAVTRMQKECNSVDLTLTVLAVKLRETLDATEIKTAYENNSNTNAYTDAEKTKLSNIETSADVTDATTVAAAGAVMEADATTAAMSFVVDLKGVTDG